MFENYIFRKYKVTFITSEEKNTFYMRECFLKGLQILWHFSHWEADFCQFPLESEGACDCFGQQNMVDVVLDDFPGQVINGRAASTEHRDFM